MPCDRIIKKKNGSKIPHKPLFKEALDHIRNRWKNSLKLYLQKIEIKDFDNMTFEGIYAKIRKDCDNIHGLGKLSAYDIASSIAREKNLTIPYVYLAGNGPRNAIKKLGVKIKYQKIINFRLPYVTINSVVDSLNEKQLDYDKEFVDEIISKNDGDSFESYLCIWQKEN
jgi:hypothetical protein